MANVPRFKGTRFAPCPPGWTDHLYKEVAGVQLPLRLWRAQDGKRHERKPWVLWIHGGGFIAGKWTAPNNWVVPGFTSRGFHVVSVGYRFMPQVSLADIVQDCQDAYSWCSKSLPEVLGDDQVDVTRWVSAGDSAGGYLAFQMAFQAQPSPSVVVSSYGVADLTACDGLNGRQSSTQTPEYHRERTVDELVAACNDKSPERAEVFCPWDGDLTATLPPDEYNRFLGTVDFKPSEKHYLRLDLNKYQSTSGYDRLSALMRRSSTTTEDYENSVKAVSPLYQLEHCSAFPPTFFLHGALDPVVGIQQVESMRSKLASLRVDTGLALDIEGSHGFEIFISSPLDEGWDEYVEPALDFVDKHVM